MKNYIAGDIAGVSSFISDVTVHPWFIGPSGVE